MTVASRRTARRRPVGPAHVDIGKRFAREVRFRRDAKGRHLLPRKIARKVAARARRGAHAAQEFVAARTDLTGETPDLVERNEVLFSKHG
jgi:hypothetical protein